MCLYFLCIKKLVGKEISYNNNTNLFVVRIEVGRVTLFESKNLSDN